MTTINRKIDRRLPINNLLQRASTCEFLYERSHIDVQGSATARWARRRLVHEPSLPVTIGVLLRVQLVHEAGLLVRAGGGVVIGAISKMSQQWLGHRSLACSQRHNGVTGDSDA